MAKKNRKKSNAGRAMEKAKQAMSSVTKPEIKTITEPAVAEKKEAATTSAAPAPAKAELKKEEPKPAPKPEVKAEVKPEPKKEEPKKETSATAKSAEKPAEKAPVKIEEKPAAKAPVKKAPAKKPAAKKKTPAKKAATAAPTYETFIEFEGAQINVTPETINARVLEAYKADGHRPGNIKSLQVYMNLNERRAYYVINGKEEGKFVEF